MSSVQEQGFEMSASKLVLSVDERQTPVRYLEMMLRSSEVTWNHLTSLILHLLVTENSAVKPFHWHKILPKLKKKQKKRSRHVHGRPLPRVTSMKRSVTCPGRRRSRPTI